MEPNKYKCTIAEGDICQAADLAAILDCSPLLGKKIECETWTFYVRPRKFRNEQRYC